MRRYRVRSALVDPPWCIFGQKGLNQNSQTLTYAACRPTGTSVAKTLCRALQRRELAKAGFPVVCMDARVAADAVKSRRVKSDKADAYALAEMLRTGWYRALYVKSAVYVKS